ncbi:MAG: SPOR domain-containing protein [Treponema sp.]|jgi:cell division protein FtsN|nr:SPOR domain-containing protein [Treponema sp.]
MEQKQSLWIIAAVGVFLLVVIGAAFILYSPSSKGKTEMASAGTEENSWFNRPAASESSLSALMPNSFGATDPVLHLQGANAQSPGGQIPAIPLTENAAPPQTATITAPNGTIIPVPVQNPQYMALLQTLNVPIQAPQGMMNTPNTATATVTIPQTVSAQTSQTSAVPQYIVSGEQTGQGYQYPGQHPALPQQVENLTVISGTTHVIGTGTTTFSGSGALSVPVEINNQNTMPVNSPASETAKPTEPAASVKPTAKPATPAAAPASAPAKASVPVKTAAVKAEPAAPNQYWVQAASYSAKRNADTVRSALEAQKLPGEVFTHAGQDGTIYYRVRVGPYETKKEAEYWQTELRRIKNFENLQTFVINSGKK